MLQSAALAQGPASAPAAPCPGPLPDTGIVSSVAPDGEIVLVDGRRLVPVEIAIEGNAATALEAAGLRSGAAVAFAPRGEIDRWERQATRIAMATPAPAQAPDWIEERAVAAGHALVRPSGREDACLAALLLAEDGARRAGRGIWAGTRRVFDAAEPDKMRAAAGTFAIAQGRIVSVGARSARTYLNFGKDWKTDLTVTIPKRVWAAMAEKGLTATALRGRLVRVRGIVEDRDGPAVEIREPGQLEWLDGDAGR